MSLIVPEEQEFLVWLFSCLALDSLPVRDCREFGFGFTNFNLVAIFLIELKQVEDLKSCFPVFVDISSVLLAADVGELLDEVSRHPFVALESRFPREIEFSQHSCALTVIVTT